MTFSGWPGEAFAFYTELEANNNRPWWKAHRDTYDRAVREPFEDLTDAVMGEFGELRMFRPNRDTRFAKDKSPYKTAAAAMTGSAGGASFYVQLSSAGLFVGAGSYHLVTDQLQRWRDAVADERTGRRIARITDGLVDGGYDIAAADSLKTTPRGWAKDHPRIELARLKGLVMARTFPRAKWQSTAKALDRITTVWRDAGPMCAWIDANIGPSTLPPPER